MSQMMRVIEIREPGGPEVLIPAMRPVPEPSAHEILIAIDHAGVNRPDALQRAGSYAPPPDASDLPGLEASGIVSAVGAEVTRWSVGDRVCALLPGGGYAEFAICHADHALAVPKNLSMAQAAAICETHFTVWSNVFTRAGLRAGERLLIHGGSSGIGTTAIQLASVFGAQVFVTAGSPDKCAACLELGAERAINYRDEDFVDVLKAEGGADVILDMVGGDYIARNLKALALDGRLVQIAFLQGPKAAVNFAPLMMRRLTITGSTLRPQSDAAKAAIAEDLRRHVWPLLEAGRIAPVMDQTFELEEAADAHTRIESSAHIGKITLRVR
ncbi:MAG: NAD(P)H-quinone oxidoreductase [Pseudomonadota bacterium]